MITTMSAILQIAVREQFEVVVHPGRRCVSAPN